MYKYVSLYVAPGQDPDGNDWGLCFLNSSNDTEDRIYLTGFPTAWHAWEFALATTGRDIAQENLPEGSRGFRYKICKEKSTQMEMFKCPKTNKFPY